MDEPVLVVGLGNPILGDDGVGWRVAEQVRARLESLEPGRGRPVVAVENLSTGGLALMERMLGYRRAIVVDALTTGVGEPGKLSCFPLRALPEYAVGHTTSAHDTSLQNALQAASEMGFNVPEEVWVVGIEAVRTDEFSEQLSAAVEAAVPDAVDQVLELLQRGAGEVSHGLT